MFLELYNMSVLVISFYTSIGFCVLTSDSVVETDSVFHKLHKIIPFLYSELLLEQRTFHLIPVNSLWFFFLWIDLFVFVEVCFTVRLFRAFA